MAMLEQELPVIADWPRPAKEPWLAVCLSLVLLGLGQFYAGARRAGLFFLLAGLLLLASAAWVFFSASGNPLLAAALALGDDSERSRDSRFFGPVPVSDVVGKVYKRYWPLSRAGPIE